jgi:hypothetical protein
LRETESIVKASVEAGKPYIPALKRPEVKSEGIAAFLSLSVEAKKRAPSRNSFDHPWHSRATSSSTFMLMLQRRWAAAAPESFGTVPRFAQHSASVLNVPAD